MSAVDCAAQDPRVTLYGPALAGTNGVPTLLSDRLPEIGGSSELRLHNGLPASNGVLFMGIDQLSVPVLGLTILVDPILTALTLPPIDPLGGSRFPIAIPPDPGLSGLTLTFQAVLVDPGAPGPLPITHTNGVQWEFGTLGVQPPPQVLSVFPPSGPAGTVITIQGAGFDPNPRNNCVFVGDFDARAMVVSATPNQLIAVLGPVNQFSTSRDVRVVRGSGMSVPNFTFDSGAFQSVSTPGQLLVAGEGLQINVFQPQFVPSSTVRAQSVGANTIAFQAQSSWTGNFTIDIYVRDASGRLTKDVHIPVLATAMTFAECVAHIRAHLLAVLPDVTVSGAPGTGTITISDPSFGAATTGSITG